MYDYIYIWCVMSIKVVPHKLKQCRHHYICILHVWDSNSCKRWALKTYNPIVFPLNLGHNTNYLPNRCQLIHTCIHSYYVLYIYRRSSIISTFNYNDLCNIGIEKKLCPQILWFSHSTRIFRMTLSHPDKQELAALPTQFCQIQKNPFVVCTYLCIRSYMNLLHSNN